MYWVIEIQKRTDGEWYEFIWHFEDLPHAEAKYYAVLSEAALSTIPINGAHLFDDKGIYSYRQVYDRTAE